MIKSALYYHKLGLSIIPIKPGEKIPLIIWKEYQERIATEEEIKKWWRKTPNANIAIVTGKLNNLAVVDFDKYDPKFSEEIALQYFPDTLETPTASTPGGGTHLYFQFPQENISNNARLLPGIDFRGEGGYVVAPPSINGNGKKYEWQTKMGDVSIADLPLDYKSIALKGNAYINNKVPYMGVTTNNENPVTSCYKMFEKGTRDNDLFHVANTLVKGGMQSERIEYILGMLANNCHPPFPANEIKTKITSALDRAARRERNLQAEVDSYIVVTNGYFSVTDCYSALQVVTKEDKTAVRVALHRRIDKTIEKYGKKDAVYQRIDGKIEFIDFAEEEGVRSQIRFPFDLHEYIEICEGNIVLVAGEYNAGKTGIALNVLWMNKNRMRIRYLSSEMKGGEFKKRWRFFGFEKDFWAQDEMTDYVALKNNLTSAILPDAVNIIDYLEFPDGDYTQGAEYMRQIHDKLTTGVAVVCIQHKENAKLPRSGDLIMEKPRLAITLKKLPTNNENINGYAEILKAKNIRLGKMDGKKLEFEIRKGGSEFHIIRDWGWWKYGK